MEIAGRLRSLTVSSEPAYFHPGIWQQQSPPVIRAHEFERLIVLMQIVVLLIVLALSIAPVDSIVLIFVRRRIVVDVG